jgi:hypothetical protein
MGVADGALGIMARKVAPGLVGGGNVGYMPSSYFETGSNRPRQRSQASQRSGAPCSPK